MYNPVKTWTTYLDDTFHSKFNCPRPLLLDPKFTEATERALILMQPNKQSAPQTTDKSNLTLFEKFPLVK